MPADVDDATSLDELLQGFGDGEVDHSDQPTPHAHPRRAAGRGHETRLGDHLGQYLPGGSDFDTWEWSDYAWHPACLGQEQDDG
jgi:hypothetical protein